MDRIESLKVERFKNGFYYNYHKHTHYSNIRTQDCVSKPIDYIERAKELGHDSYFTTEHGWQGNIFECFTLCQQNNLKCIYGVEAYYVDDMYEQDRGNYHLMLVALNKEGRQEINTILSKANTDGFYYKPRIDLKCLLSLTPGNVIVTSSCVASRLFKGNDWEEKFLKPVLNHFKDHFFLEVQAHPDDVQRRHNKLIILMHKKYNIPLIHANDSHYIYEQDAIYRDMYLKAKGIVYEDESNFILDYPSVPTIVRRYKQQGVLNDKQIFDAITNTYIFDECEPIYIDKEFKLPKIIQGDSNKYLKDLLLKEWDKKKCKTNPKRRKEYYEAITSEYKTVVDCGMADYFILNHAIVERAVNEYNAVITRSGRGCFTADALVHTRKMVKPINQVIKGDYVVDINGEWKQVLNTIRYDIQEDMIKITHQFSNEDNLSICTLNHKILILKKDYVTRDGMSVTVNKQLALQWIEAKDVKPGDYVCFPNNQQMNNLGLGMFENREVFADKKYVYFVVENVEVLKNVKTSVYDLEVEDSHSYLLNNMIVHNSAVSFYINNLLGLTEVDRLKAPTKLYPSRFMSAERILSSRSLPDIDLNVSNVEPIIKSAKDILGDDNIYYMVAYGTMKDSQAFKMWCKAKGLDFDAYNEIGKNIDDYREHHYWGKLIKDSSVFLGVIDSISPSPCSLLLLDKPISNEIGLIKVGDRICCCLDGYNCDVYKYVKDDFLIVTVWDIIDKVYKKLRRPIDDISFIINHCDQKVWDLIGNGITTTINQCDSDYDKQILKKYKPQNLAEMAAYVAAIRPGFASLLNNFIERKPYSTGVEELDELLKDSFHYLMYQESIMTYLVWLGIEEKETYDTIKKISKKKFTPEALQELEQKLEKGWMDKIGKMDGFAETWKVVNDAAKYSFNASHALSVAIDALYGSYLKTHYPLEYFSVVFDLYSDDKVRTGYLTKELEYFGIKLHSIKFGKSRANYMEDKENNSIYKGVLSVKYCNEIIAEELYELSQHNTYNNFVDLLVDIKNKTSVNSRQMNVLIGLNYFSDFGENQYLFDIYEMFNKLKQGNIKQIKKDKLDELGISEYYVKKYSEKETAKLFREINGIGLLKELVNDIPNKSMNVQDQVKFEMDNLEYVEYFNHEIDYRYYIVLKITTNKDPRKPRMVLRCLNDGEEISTRIKRGNHFIEDPFKQYSILRIDKLDKENKVRPDENGKWVKIDEYEDILNDYEVMAL